MLVVEGLVIGLAMVAPVGPVALAVIGIGIERGRRYAVRGALGVATADAVLLLTVGLLAGRAGILELAFTEQVTVVLGLVLVAIGAHVVWTGERSLERLGDITHPATALLVMTLANPLSLAVWLGVVAALPRDTLRPASWPWFAAGVILASVAWHLGLAVGAAWIGERVTSTVRRWSAVAGGVVVAGVGLALIV